MSARGEQKLKPKGRGGVETGRTQLWCGERGHVPRIEPQVCTEALDAELPSIRASINSFSATHFHCLGGRLGSGLGSLLEALWAFYARHALNATIPGEYEIAWMVENAYNDLAVVDAQETWNPSTRAGEVLRIEAKSMNLDAEETKGHFDALQSEIGEHDLLLVVVWKWVPIQPGSQVVYPRVLSEYMGNALEVARLRDALHLARGGSFVAARQCPDGCSGASCVHVGEPLNAKRRRERRTGPETARSGKISHAANFGGLKRMIAVRGPASTALVDQMTHPARKAYVDFIRSFSNLGI